MDSEPFPVVAPPPLPPKPIASHPLTKEKNVDTLRDNDRDKERTKALQVEKSSDKRAKAKVDVMEADDPSRKKSVRAKRVLSEVEAVSTERKKDGEEEEGEEVGGIETLRDERDRKEKVRSLSFFGLFDT